MNILQRITTILKGGFLSSADFEGLSPEAGKRLFGSNYSESEYLSAYGKSLYVYACVSKIAEKVASTDFKLLKIINKDGDTEEVKDHPALDLLYRWNPTQTKEECIETDVINRKLTGDSFIYKVRNDGGVVVELWNIRPDIVTIFQDGDGNVSHYEVNLDKGGKERIAVEDMIHIKYPSPLSTINGMSPLSSTGTRIQTEQYASEYQRDFFLNNARVDGTLETDQYLTPEQKREMLDKWNEKHRGRGKNSKTAILDGGIKYNQISLSQREMDYIESMKFTRDDILVAFKTPKPIISISDSVGRSRAEAETLLSIYLSETIIPEIKRFVNKLNEELIIPDFGEEYYLTFDDPVPANREQKLAEYSAGVDKWITRNEIRQEMGLEPLQGADALYSGLGQIELNTERQSAESDYKMLHGRKLLKTKFALKDSISGIKQEIKKEITKKENKIKESSLFKDKTQRKLYYDYMMKNIDDKARVMQNAVIKLKNEQKDEILKALKKSKPKTMAEIRKLFNLKEQNKKLFDWAMARYIPLFKEAGSEALSLLTLDKPFSMEEKSYPKIGFYLLLEKRAKLFATSVNKTTRDMLVNALSEGITAGEGIDKLSKRVSDVYLDFNDYRAERIARTETNAVVNEANLEAYKQADAEGKERIATLDDRVRDEHLLMDGEIRRVGEPFSNGEMFPGEDSINCRCTIAPVTRIID